MHKKRHHKAKEKLKRMLHQYQLESKREADRQGVGNLVNDVLKISKGPNELDLSKDIFRAYKKPSSEPTPPHPNPLPRNGRGR